MTALDSILSHLFQFGMTAGVRLIGSILIVVIGFIVTGKLVKAIKRSPRIASFDKNVVDFITSFIKIALNIIIVLTAANYLGVPMTNIVAILASCGLAVGLALQGSLSNLAGGLMILIFKPCRSGDFISVNGLEGTVSEITILYTYLKTPDNKTVIIPNSTVSNSPITNYSIERKRRADVSISVSYKSDVHKVKTVLEEFVKTLPNIEKQPECAVILSSYDESGITFTIRAWTSLDHYWSVIGDINYGLQKVLADNGIEIPYPQIDVHLDK